MQIKLNYKKHLSVARGTKVFGSHNDCNIMFTNSCDQWGIKDVVFVVKLYPNLQKMVVSNYLHRQSEIHLQQPVFTVIYLFFKFFVWIYNQLVNYLQIILHFTWPTFAFQRLFVYLTSLVDLFTECKHSCTKMLQM